MVLAFYCAFTCQALYQRPHSKHKKSTFAEAFRFYCVGFSGQTGSDVSTRIS